VPDNVEIVRIGYEAYARDGVPGLLPLLDEQIEWRNPEDSPVAGIWRGHQGVRDWFAQTQELIGEMWFVPDEFVALPDGRVLVLCTAGIRPRHMDTPMEFPFAHLITLHDGLATHFWMYSDVRRAREAAGL
jgi:uncharacterized protein